MSAIVTLGFDGGAVARGIKQAENQIKSFEGVADKVMGRLGKGVGLAAAFSLPGLTRFGSDLLASAGKMEGYRAALNAVSKDSSGLEAQLQRLRELAKSPGLSFDEAVKGTIRLQATGFSAAEAERALREFANGLRSVGGSASELDGITLALGQIMGKGKVMAQEINQIAERMPQVRELMKGAFGTTDSEAIQRMGLDSKSFISGLVDQLAKGPRVANGFNSAIEQLHDNLEQLKAATGTPFAESLAPIIKSLAADVDGFQKKVKTFANAVVNVAPQVVTLGGALTGLWLAFKAARLAEFVAAVLAKTRAVQGGTSVVTAETTAVQANTAAHRANAAARAAGAASGAAMAGPGKVGLRESRTPAGAVNVGQVWSRPMLAAGQAGAQNYAKGFAATFQGTGAAVAGGAISLAAGAWTNSMAPKGIEAGELLAKHFGDSFATTLAVVWPGVGTALAGLWHGSMAVLMRGAQSAEMADALTESVATAMQAARAKIEGGDRKGALDAILQQRNILAERAANAKGEEQEVSKRMLALVEREISLLPKREASLKAAAELAKERAKWASEELSRQMQIHRWIEARAATEARAAEARKKFEELSEKVMEARIDLAPPDNQIAYWQQRLEASIKGAVGAINADLQMSGLEPVIGVERTLEGIKRLAEELAAKGDWLNAQEAMEAYQKAFAIQGKIKAAQDKQTEKDKEVSDEAAAAAVARQEFDLENQILNAKIESGKEDGKAVQALEDRLTALQLARQIEDAGIAAGAEAVALAEKRVAMERAAAQAILMQEKARQQAQGKQEIMDEYRLLQAKAAGREDIVEKLEREASIKQRAAQIETQTGVSKERALQIARQMQALAEQAEKREGKSQSRGDSRYDETGRRLSDGRRKIRTNLEQWAAARGEQWASRIDAFHARHYGGTASVMPTQKLDQAARREAKSEGDSTLLGEIKAVMESVNGHLERLSAE